MFDRILFLSASTRNGREERNSDHLLENGAAVRSNNPTTLGYKFEQLLNDPKKIASMKSTALSFARPRAAFDIANKLAELGT